MASKTQELPPHVACKCVRSDLDNRIISSLSEDATMVIEPSKASSLIEALLVIVAELDLLPLLETELGRLMLACKQLYAGFLQSKIWVARLGYFVKNPEPSLAQFRVFLALRENISNGTWDSSQLVKAGTWCSGGHVAQTVEEKVKAESLTPLLVPVDGSKSVAFWLKNLVDVLRTPNYPTSDQAEQLETAMHKLLDLGASGAHIVEAATSIQKPNKVLVCVLVKEFFKKRSLSPNGSDEEAGAESSRDGWDSVATLMRSVEMVLHTCQLLKGCSLASLKENKREATPRPQLRGRGRGRAAPAGRASWRAQWVSKGNYSGVFKRAVVRALGAMGWMQLSQCFAASRSGKLKALFRNMHITAVVNAELKALRPAAQQPPPSAHPDAAARAARQVASAREEAERGLRRVYLLVAMVREDKYPADAEEFADREWAEAIVAPLQAMLRDPMFDLDPRWLQSAFCEELAGKRLPHPLRNTVECVLARDGCTHEAWRKLFSAAAAGALTVNHVLSNIRNLALLDFEPAVVQDFLQAATDKGQVQWVQALKGLLALERDLSLPAVEQLQREIQAAVALEAPEEQEGPLVRLPMKRTFKDKKGHVTEQEKRKAVARAFGPPAVHKYTQLLSDVTGSALDDAVCTAQRRVEAALSKAELAKPAQMEVKAAPEAMVDVEEGAGGDAGRAVERGERAAVVLLTPELALNVARSGEPPSIPDFSRTALWRNEAVSLAQVAGPEEEVEKLLVGVTWQPKDASTSMILDLSVMLFDGEWNYVDECSWQKLESEGLKHSGDWCGQLATLRSLGQEELGQARETIEIDVRRLRARAPYLATVPRARRVALDDEQLEDAADGQGAVGKVRYVVAGSFAYSDNDIEDFKAAAYVANPAVRGSGPGGMSVLTAQHLTGKGKVNVGLMLDLYHPDGGVVALNIDHTLPVTFKNAASTAFPEVREECRKVLEGIAGGARIDGLAMLFGAALADKVLVVHGGDKEEGEGALVAQDGALVWRGLDTARGGIAVGGEAAWAAAAEARAARAAAEASAGDASAGAPRGAAEVLAVERREGEGTMALFARVREAARGKRCTLQPLEGLRRARKEVEGRREVVVACGELDDEEALAAALAEGAEPLAAQLVLANLRGHDRSHQQRSVDGRTLRLVRGWDVIDLLVGA